jgi:C_GCAxxG_C_C family probable redox protein
MAGEVCGALSGGVLSIGLLYNQEGEEEVKYLTEQFMHRFVDQHGAVRCSDIIGFNIGSIEKTADLKSLRGLLTFGMRGGKKMCNQVVRSAVEALLDELEEWEA